MQLAKVERHRLIESVVSRKRVGTQFELLDALANSGCAVTQATISRDIHELGLEKTHDLCVEREGVFRAAVAGIKAAKKAGFLVCTNTTIFKETDIKEVDALFGYLTKLGESRGEHRRSAVGARCRSCDRACA